MIRRWLFFDIEIQGHHSEYFSHLTNYIMSNQCGDSYIFLVHPEFSKLFFEIVNTAKAANNITFIEISYAELQEANKGGIVKRSISSYHLMNKYATANAVTNVCLLYFNTFQLALGIFRSNYKISGILFLQFYRMERTRFIDKLKYLRKYMQTWFFVNNKQIERVFVFNDPETAAYLNNEFKTSIFQMLPDPIPELIPLPDFSVREAYRIEPDRKIFLHIGELSERKGTLNILEAFNHLPVKDISKMVLFLIGKATPQTDNFIVSAIDSIQNKYPEALIVYKNEFVENRMMKSFFNQCDVVLIPYKNVEASSGIFGHAISSGKPVIGSKTGLLGEMIIKNKAGITIEDSTPEFISLGMQEFLNEPVKRYTNNIYLAAHSTQKFAEIILA